VSVIRELVTALANGEYLPLPADPRGCPGCRTARALNVFRATLVSEWMQAGHVAQLGPTFVDGRYQLAIFCEGCGSAILAHVARLPQGDTLWVDSVTLMGACKRS
jgi:hypothetical protein